MAYKYNSPFSAAPITVATPFLLKEEGEELNLQGHNAPIEQTPQASHESKSLCSPLDF